MKELAKRNAAIKKALRNKWENVTVRGERGTATGWVNIHLNLVKPAQCSCPAEMRFYSERCKLCKDTLNEASDEAELIAIQAAKDAGSYIGTYCADDSYNTQDKQIIIQKK